MALRHWLLLILLSFMWGGSFFFNSILIKAVGPWTLTAGRVVIGALGVWAYVLLSGKKIPTEPKLWGFYLLLGGISYALPFTAIAWGQQQITGGLASIINAMNPITILIVTHFWPGGEKATQRKFIGIILGFIGVTILTLPKLKAGETGELLAYLAVYSATFCYAIGLNMVRHLKHHPPVVTAAGGLTGASIVALLCTYFVEGVPGHFDTSVWLAFLGIGLVSTALAFTIMYTLLPQIGPVNFSLVTFMVPISAIFLGTTFLAETIQLSQLIGMGTIFLGLLFIDGRMMKRLKIGRR